MPLIEGGYQLRSLSAQNTTIPQGGGRLVQRASASARLRTWIPLTRASKPTVSRMTATRLSYRLNVSYAAVTVFDSSDAKTVADQLRALANRIDPQSSAVEPASRKRSSRRRMRLLP